jgi:hypothetical protein
MLRQCLAVAVQRGSDRNVIVAKSLIPHRHTMLTQDLDSTAVRRYRRDARHCSVIRPNTIAGCGNEHHLILSGGRPR